MEEDPQTQTDVILNSIPEKFKEIQQHVRINEAKISPLDLLIQEIKDNDSEKPMVEKPIFEKTMELQTGLISLLYREVILSEEFAEAKKLNNIYQRLIKPKKQEKEAEIDQENSYNARTIKDAPERISKLEETFQNKREFSVKAAATLAYLYKIYTDLKDDRPITKQQKKFLKNFRKIDKKYQEECIKPAKTHLKIQTQRSGKNPITKAVANLRAEAVGDKALAAIPKFSQSDLLKSSIEDIYDLIPETERKTEPNFYPEKEKDVYILQAAVKVNFWSLNTA